MRKMKIGVSNILRRYNGFFQEPEIFRENLELKKVENQSKSPLAIYGFLIHVELWGSDKIIFVEKTEHIQRVF